jgi:hypothetical protein
MTCDEARALAAEVALGLVTGPERAEVLAHLDACVACRREVEELAGVSDRVVLFAPSAEPPAGFEVRVLERIDDASHGAAAAAGTARRRSRRWLVPVAAALVAIAATVGIVAANADRDETHLVEAPMRTLEGRDVGTVYLHTTEPGWVFVNVPGWSRFVGDTYLVQAELVDGSTVDLGSLTFEPDDDGGWGTATSLDPTTITQLSMVDDQGVVWCIAEMPESS